MLDFNICFVLLCNILLSQCIVASVLAWCCYLYLWGTARNNVYFHSVPFLNTSKLLKQNKTKQKLPFFSLTELLLFPSPFFCCLPSKFLILPADLLQLLVLCFHPYISLFFGFFSPFSFPVTYLSSVLYTVPFFVLLNSVSSAHPSSHNSL